MACARDHVCMHVRMYELSVCGCVCGCNPWPVCTLGDAKRATLAAYLTYVSYLRELLTSATYVSYLRHLHAYFRTYLLT